jgi:tetratricopeptide (TPR) repeat protein
MRTTTDLRRGLSTVRKLWREQQFGSALEEVNRLLEERPDNAPLLVMRAELIQLQDDEEGVPTLDDARADLKQAVALDETSPTPLIELAYFLFAVDDDAESASRYFQRAIKLGQSLLKEALVGQAEALSELGRESEAIDCLIQAYGLNPQNDKSGREDVRERLRSLQPSN